MIGTGVPQHASAWMELVMKMKKKHKCSHAKKVYKKK